MLTPRHLLFRWARENAESNQLGGHPIRWIVEDARKFAAREVKRGRKYDLLVLDPPSFGHGPSGLRWQIESDLFPLLENCLHLLSPQGACCSRLTLQTPRLMRLLSGCTVRSVRSRGIVDYLVKYQRLELVDQHQRPLDAGFSIRCQLT